MEHPPAVLKRSVVIGQRISVESVKSRGGAYPNVPVLFLADAVYGGGQSFFLGYLSIYVLFLCGKDM